MTECMLTEHEYVADLEAEMARAELIRRADARGPAEMNGWKGTWHNGLFYVHGEIVSAEWKDEVAANLEGTRD